MKKIALCISSLLSFLVIASLMAGMTYSENAEAADGCPNQVGTGIMKTRKIIKLAGGSFYPASCKMQACRPPGSETVKVQVTTALPPVMTIVYHYKHVAGIAPSNWCPLELGLAAWTTN